MKVHRLALFLVLFSLSAVTTAAPFPPGYPGSFPRHNADKLASSSPDAIVKAGVNKLTKFIRSGRAEDREQALAFMTTEVEPYFDFEYMTRWAAGPAWQQMSPQQRAFMQDQLKKSFMNTLASKLVTYTDQPIRYFTPRGQDGNDVRVSAWIMQPTGIPTKLEFRFYKNGDQWKIFDVKAEGTSAVVYYRKQFRHLMQPELARSY
ncbi:MAG: ABC transporter substrate-binding protein [Pseudomonadota bacterium]